MYIKNAEKFLTKLNFIGDRTHCTPEEQTCEYYLKVNEHIQLFVVTTSEDDIMFISEHKVHNPHNKFFEDDENNYTILSEYSTIGELSYVLYKNNVVSKLYYNLMNTIQRLIIAKNTTLDKNIEDEIQEMIDWADLTIYYMNEEHENTIWASENDIEEFIKIAIEFCKNVN